jgi:hypothetical protein
MRSKSKSTADASKSKVAEPAPKDAVAFSVDQFCQRNGICKAHFYNAVRAGRGPRLMKVGRRTLVTRQAETDWHGAVEAATAE